MIKFDMHVHCSGASICADVTIEQLIDRYLSCGYKGVVLTNHINPKSYNAYEGLNHKQKTDYFFNVADKAVSLGREKGIKVLIGAEIRANTLDNTFQEYTIIGFERALLYDNKPLFELDQKQIFKLCEKNHLFMLQTHPFREGVTCGNPDYLHGAEAFNGHFHHDNNNQQALEFCQKYNLKMFSGTDFHHNIQPIIGGVYLPDFINNEVQLAEYLLNNQPRIIVDQSAYQLARQQFLSTKE